jgi:hypothetical protein
VKKFFVLTTALIAAVLLGLVQAQAAPLFSHSTLQQSLIAYWRLEETSGTRLDDLNGCGGSGCDLTDNNTVTNNTGIIGNAGQFVQANSEYLSHTDNADLSTGDIDFTIATWVYLNSKAGTEHIFAKWGAAGQREYRLIYETAVDRFQFIVSADGTASATRGASSFGSPSLSTWYYIIAWHDSTANTINIQVNNGTVDSTSYSSGVFGSTSILAIGASSAPAGYIDGRIDEVGFWKKVLTSGERTLLYNSGAGCQNTFETCEGTHTPTPSDTPTATATDTPTASDTPTATATDTPTPSDTPTDTPTPSDTPTITFTPSETLTPSDTPVDTPTPSETPTASDTPTETATPTITLTPTVTRTPTPTRTPAICPTDDAYSFSFVTTAGNECVRVVRQVTFGEIYMGVALFMLFALGALYFSWKVITRWTMT